MKRIAAFVIVFLVSALASHAWATPVTVSYSYTSPGEYALDVPVDIAQAHVHVIGAAGGGPNGGAGADVVGTIPVIGGAKIYIEVGGDGTSAGGAGGTGGFNGGGNGGSARDLNGAGGGGASDIRTCSRNDTCTTDSRLVVAGGGGGTDGGIIAGAAGSGVDPVCNAGALGLQYLGGFAGGSGGTCDTNLPAPGGFGPVPGAPGQAFTGGDGSSASAQFACPATFAGGGGGGGYVGGGGGAGGCLVGGSGGGGSSYATPASTGVSMTPATTAAGVVVTFDAVVPEAPTNVRAKAGNHRAIVSWLAPPVSLIPVTSYTVTTSPPDVAPLVVNGSLTKGVVSGLRNGKKYTFTVIATNGVGPSVASLPSNVVRPRR